MRPDEQAEAERLQKDDEPRARDVIYTEGAPVLDLSERWETLHLVEEPALRTYVQHEMPMHLDPGEWRTGFLSVHERELPPALYADLRELAPQSLLRDLHRPVRQFFVTPEEIEGSRVVGRWQEGRDDIRQALVREPLPTIEPLVREVRAEQERRQALLDEPWKPLLDDDAPRRTVKLYPDEPEE